MSRSGYSDDYENLELYRGAVHRAMMGKRGQRLLRDLVSALDAMPEKRLAAGSFQRQDGDVCALGAVGVARGFDMTQLEQLAMREDGIGRHAAKVFDVAPSLAAEVMFENDECGPWGRVETPEERWHRIREWACKNIREVE